MASLNISDHEHEQRLLAVSLQPYFFEACLGCATAGVLLFMCIYGLNLYLETPKVLRQGRCFYVAISFVILVFHGWAELPASFKIFQLLYHTSNWREVYSFRDELNMTWWANASQWATSILVWVGDGLLVYRCYIVWTGRPKVTVLPATVYLATLGVSIYDLITYLSGSKSQDVYAAWVFLSVGVNCIVTALISLRLLHVRRQNAAIMVPVDSKLYIGVVTILVESALPLALVGVVVAGSSWVDSQSSSAMANIFAMVWFNLTALAPALIIFRVAAGRSWDHSTRNDSHLSSLALQPHTPYSSGGTREDEAAPLDKDVEKNASEGAIVTRDRISGSNSDLADGSSDLHLETRKRDSV